MITNPYVNNKIWKFILWNKNYYEFTDLNDMRMFTWDMAVFTWRCSLLFILALLRSSLTRKCSNSVPWPGTSTQGREGGWSSSKDPTAAGPGLWLLSLQCLWPSLSPRNSRWSSPYWWLGHREQQQRSWNTQVEQMSLEYSTMFYYLQLPDQDWC